ncbi:MAG: hypothetical protein OEW72_10345 [Gammaproteobacteria bacterium]|nr:hypothetical protein [Gammaproteobacteria bacterium]
MAKRRYTSEKIIHTLREADVLLGHGKTTGETCKAIGITDHTYSAGASSSAGSRWIRRNA